MRGQNLTLNPIIIIASGFRAEGHYDAGSENLLSLHVDFRLSAENKGQIKSLSASNSGAIRVHSDAHGLITGDDITVINVRGTVEANGSWKITVINSNLFDLRDSRFQNAYTSGGDWTVEDEWKGVRVEGSPPRNDWSKDVIVNRSGHYDVRARMNWTGSPSVLTTEARSVEVQHQ